MCVKKVKDCLTTFTAISVLFPFRSLPSKIPLNTSPKAPLPNKLEAKKSYNNEIKKIPVGIFFQYEIFFTKNGDVIVEITNVLI